MWNSIDLCYIWAKFFKKFRSSAIKKSHIHKTSKVEAGSSIINTIMDKHSFCGYDCEIINCRIGSFVSIANQVVIGGGEHPMHWVGMSPVFYEGRDSIKAKFSKHERQNLPVTTIGHDVWIGQRALLKSGISVGVGAVIGMGSVVTKDVEAYAIVAGNPARLIRKRFDDETIRMLLQSKWWAWPEGQLRQYAVFFNNVELFLKKIRPE